MSRELKQFLTGAETCEGSRVTGEGLQVSPASVAHAGAPTSFSSIPHLTVLKVEVGANEDSRKPGVNKDGP